MACFATYCRAWCEHATPLSVMGWKKQLKELMHAHKHDTSDSGSQPGSPTDRPRKVAASVAAPQRSSSSWPGTIHSCSSPQHSSADDLKEADREVEASPASFSSPVSSRSASSPLWRRLRNPKSISNASAESSDDAGSGADSPKWASTSTVHFADPIATVAPVRTAGHGLAWGRLHSPRHSPATQLPDTSPSPQQHTVRADSSGWRGSEPLQPQLSNGSTASAEGVAVHTWTAIALTPQQCQVGRPHDIAPPPTSTSTAFCHGSDAVDDALSAPVDSPGAAAAGRLLRAATLPTVRLQSVQQNPSASRQEQTVHVPADKPTTIPPVSMPQSHHKELPSHTMLQPQPEPQPQPVVLQTEEPAAAKLPDASSTAQRHKGVRRQDMHTSRFVQALLCIAAAMIALAAAGSFCDTSCSAGLSAATKQSHHQHVSGRLLSAAGGRPCVSTALQPYGRCMPLLPVVSKPLTCPLQAAAPRAEAAAVLRQQHGVHPECSQLCAALAAAHWRFWLKAHPAIQAQFQPLPQCPIDDMLSSPSRTFSSLLLCARCQRLTNVLSHVLSAVAGSGHIGRPASTGGRPEYARNNALGVHLWPIGAAVHTRHHAHGG